MKSVFLCVALLLQRTGDRSSLWESVSVGYDPARPTLSDVQLVEDQKRSIEGILKRDYAHAWTCDIEDPGGEWVHRLSFKRIPLSDKYETILVNAGSGCASSGQGINAAMWVVELAGGKASILAGPQKSPKSPPDRDDFGGYLFCVQASASRGYRDIVLGWRMGGSQTNLVYFRFDGTRYRMLGRAAMRWR